MLKHTIFALLIGLGVLLAVPSATATDGRAAMPWVQPVDSWGFNLNLSPPVYSYGYDPYYYNYPRYYTYPRYYSYPRYYYGSPYGGSFYYYDRDWDRGKRHYYKRHDGYRHRDWDRRHDRWDRKDRGHRRHR